MTDAASAKMIVPGDDRRRNPRFSCGGEAKVISLPSDGILVPGTIRDLSLGGCCLEMTSPLPQGVRAEVLLRVQASCFRALAQVRDTRSRFGIGLQFLRLSSRGQEMLAELVAELARLQEIVKKVKAAPEDVDPGILDQLMHPSDLSAIALNQRIPIFRNLLPRGPLIVAPQPVPAASESDDEPEVVPVDLFI